MGAEQEHRQGLTRPCRLRAAVAWSLAAAALGLFGAGVVAQPSMEAVVCAADDQQPAPCRLQESLRDDGSHVMMFERGNTRHTFEFIPISSFAAKVPSAPGSYATHSRVPSPDRGCRASTVEADL